MSNLSRNKALLYFGVPLLLAAVITGSVVAVRAQDSSNPDAGLTDAQRDAKYTALEKTSVAISRNFEATFVASGAPIANLRRVPDQAEYVPSDLDLTAATAKASEIVRGMVTGQRLEFAGPDDGWTTRVVSTIAVTRRLKGDSAQSTVEISQAGSPSLTQDFGVVLEFDEDDPPVRIGTEVIVFGASRNGHGYLTALPYKILTVVDGRIEPNARDKPLAALHGDAADSITQDIANTVAVDAAGVAQ